jgi:hypothetical protein
MKILLLIITKVFPACFILGFAGCMIAGLKEYIEACEEGGWSMIGVLGAVVIVILIMGWMAIALTMFGNVEDSWDVE